MCYEYRRFSRKAKDEERARKEVETAIEKARREGKPKPAAPAEERPVTAEEPAAS